MLRVRFAPLFGDSVSQLDESAQPARQYRSAQSARQYRSATVKGLCSLRELKPILGGVDIYKRYWLYRCKLEVPQWLWPPESERDFEDHVHLVQWQVDSNWKITWRHCLALNASWGQFHGAQLAYLDRSTFPTSSSLWGSFYSLSVPADRVVYLSISPSQIPVEPWARRPRWSW